jgi:hypothetical protein
MSELQPQHLKLAFINSQGMMKKARELEKYRKQQNIDILIIAETWLHSEHNSPPLNWSIVDLRHAKPRMGRAKGGLLAVADRELLGDCKIVAVDDDKRWFIIKTLNIFIAGTYFEPTCGRNAFQTFWNALQRVTHGGILPCFVLGDFNIRLGDLTGDLMTSAKSDILNNWNNDPNWMLLSPDIGKWTSFTYNGHGIPDHAFCSVAALDLLETYEVQESHSCGGSDHRPLVLTAIDPGTRKKKGYKRWDIQKLKRIEYAALYCSKLASTKPLMMENLLHIQQNLLQRTSAMSQLDRQSTVDVGMDCILKWIHSAAAQSVGVFSYGRGNNCAFEDQQLDDLAQDMNERLAEHAAEGNPRIKRLIWRQFRNVQKRYHKRLLDRKRNIWEDHADLLNKPGNQPLFLKTISSINKRRTRSPCNLEESQMASHSQYFVNNTFGKHPDGSDHLIDRHFLTQTSPLLPKLIIRDVEVSEDAVERIIKLLPNGKTPGKDGIFNELLKVPVQLIKKPLAILFELCNMLRCVPSIWKEALIVPVYKQKGDNSVISNYRPIALTSSIRRIYERLLAQKLKVYDYCLQSSQGGFRPSRSTYDQIIVLEELCKSHPNAFHAFLDIKTAYDCIDRRILWKRLHTKTGIDLLSLELLRNLFDDNRSSLVINGVQGVPIPNKSGLLQGSSLSPILFNYFIDDLIQKLSDQEAIQTLGISTNNRFFADDGALHSLTAPSLRRLLHIAETWSLENGMQFAPLKCAILSPDPAAEFKLYNAVVPHVVQFKYLGLIFERTGINWKQCIDSRIQKVEKLIRWMKSTGMHLYGWRPSSSILIYKTFLRPMLEYGLAVARLPADLLARIQRVQNLALRTIFSCGFSTSIAAMHSLGFVVPIEHRNLELNARYFRKLYDSEDFSNSAVTMIHTLRTMNDDDIVDTMYFQTKQNLLLNELDVNRHERQALLRTKRLRSILMMNNSNRNNVAKAITVSSDGKANSLLYAHFLPRETVALLVQWRLGRVAYHQRCRLCNDSVSRQHALDCTDATRILRRHFPATTMNNVQKNSLDACLESLSFRPVEQNKINAIADILNTIKIHCLGWRRNVEGRLVHPDAI